MHWSHRDLGLSPGCSDHQMCKLGLIEALGVLNTLEFIMQKHVMQSCYEKKKVKSVSEYKET